MLIIGSLWFLFRKNPSHILLCFIQGERHILGIGEVSGRDILRKELVHRLALGPASRSEIVKNLPSKDPDCVSNLKL